MDISQAFDRVWHQGLISKVKSHGWKGWDFASKLKFLIMVKLLAARTILVSSDVQVDTLSPCGPYA